jgi:protein TonB
VTTPGGDIGEATEPQAPVTSARRGFDWIALLAWGAAIGFAVALAALPVLLLKFTPLGEVLDDFRISVDLPEPEPEIEKIQPLPGRPPEVTSGRKAREGGVIVNPAWVVQSRPEFPELAMTKGVESGRVELQCPVSAEGIIESCWILSETPAGVGFGQAALTAAAQARLQPRTVDGAPTAGMVRFSTSFRLR